MAHRYSFAAQAASGLKYLAGKGFIHMDVAARNFLLGERGQVKIADFTLTKRIPNFPKNRIWKFKKGRLQLPMRYQSPDAMKRKQFSEKSDVWGYGVALWYVSPDTVICCAPSKVSENTLLSLAVVILYVKPQLQKFASAVVLPVWLAFLFNEHYIPSTTQY